MRNGLPMMVSAVVLLAAGCTAAPYVEPAGAETATLRIESQTKLALVDELEASTYSDSQNCAGKQRIALPDGMHHGIGHTLRIAANSEFTLTVRATRGSSARIESCTTAGTFKPLAGTRYLALIRSDISGCGLSIMRERILDSGAKGYVREPSYRLRPESACR